jgi:hypothetical protein
MKLVREQQAEDELMRQRNMEAFEPEIMDEDEFEYQMRRRAE